MKFEEYLDSLRGKSVAVIGIGVSNQPLIRLLLDRGIRVTACDKKSREALGPLGDELEQHGCRLQLGADYLKGLTEDVIFRTPGLRPDVPELSAAVARGSRLTSEMEAFFEVCPCGEIAVTGSDGKTTTTTIIAKLLEAAGRTVHLGGNIGHPLLCDTPDIRPTDLAVLELSSFQLMTMERSPHIAVMTNLSPNHLDVHKSYQEYITAKENIFTHQTDQDIAIFNADNEATVRCAEKAPGRVRWFSRKREVADGVFLRGTSIVCRDAKGERVVMDTADIKLPGVHNIENYMAAIAAVDGLVSDETIREYAKSFGGVAHRIELVRKLDGVRYYNDSIASSPTRTIAGLRSFSEKVILIAGGYDKHIPYDVLGPEIVKSVKCLILTGATSDKIQQATQQAPDYTPGNPEIRRCDNLEQAVHTAHDVAQPGDVVILSPASASFDCFRNFEERGNKFKQYVNALEGVTAH